MKGEKMNDAPIGTEESAQDENTNGIPEEDATDEGKK